MPESVLWVGAQQGLFATNNYTKAYTLAEIFEPGRGPRYAAHRIRLNQTKPNQTRQGECTAVVEPIGDSQQRQVKEMTAHFICQAESIYNRSFERVPVLFDLRGRVAGMFKVAGRAR